MNEIIDNNKFEEVKNRRPLERIDGKYIWNEIRCVLNFDKGIFYTIKELIIRPGNTVREFLIFDRKRLVKPIIFVIFSSLLFALSQQIFGFQTGSSPDGINSLGIQMAFEWVGKNFGFVNILLGFLIGFWVRLFYLKSKFNIYEIFILVFFIIGVGNLIYTILGIIETITSFDVNNLAYLFSILYSTWAIGNFFNKKSFWSYFKGLLAFLLGSTVSSILIVIAGLLIDVINNSL